MADAKTAGEILESVVVDDGRKELRRGSLGLAFSGFAATITSAEILSPAATHLLLERVSDELGHGFWVIAFKGVFGGWLVAFIAWLVAASRDTTSQIIFV